MKTLTVPAVIDQLDTVLTFIQTQLQEIHCSQDVLYQVSIAVEEIFVNIAHYAYTPEKGEATIYCQVSNDPFQIIIQFLDSGIPYDPLAKNDPDTSLPATSREIGGLGIFLVKQMMDDVSYEYRDGKNILTIRKKVS